MIIDKDVEEFIEHHGIKGMKWGIRNKRRQPTISRGSKRKARVQGPSVHDISDEDLRKAVSRMQLEQQYKTLTQKNKTTSLGARAAQNLLRTTTGIASNAAKETAKNMLAKRMQSALEEAMKGKKNRQGKLF
jgi:hypothetical protein